MRWLVLLAVVCVPLEAQFNLSAMAGYIHRVEGEALLDGKPISPTPADFLHVQQGQRLAVGAGLVEILIVPGSFLRLGPGAEIEMVRPGLTSAMIRLIRGSAVVDLETIFEPDSIAIQMGAATISFPKTGLYRFDAPDGLLVFSGRARVSTSEGEYVVKSRRRAMVSSALAEMEKFDGKASDDQLATWQAERHELLAVAEKTRLEDHPEMDAAEHAIVRAILRPPQPNPLPRQTSSPGRR